MKNDFFTQDAKDLLVLLEMNCLRFKVIRQDSGTSKEKDLLIFEKNISPAFIAYTKAILPDRSYYFSGDIVNALLNILKI